MRAPAALPRHSEPAARAADGPAGPPMLGHALMVDLRPPTGGTGDAYDSAALADHMVTRGAVVDVLAEPALPCRRPDLVIGFLPGTDHGEAAVDVARAAHAPLVLVIRELARVDLDRKDRSLGSASRVAVPSELFRDPVSARGVAADRIAVLPDWAHVVSAWLDRREARRALGWSERAFIAVHLNGTRADPVTAVRAAGLAGPDVTMILVGELPDHVRSYAGTVPNVSCATPLSTAERPLALVAADVVVLTEAWDGSLAMPGDLASGLAAARPVLGCAPADSVLRLELARVPGGGLVLPAGGARPLARALDALRRDPARRVAMGLAALAYAEAELSLPRAMARFDDLVAATLAETCCTCWAPATGA